MTKSLKKTERLDEIFREAIKLRDCGDRERAAGILSDLLSEVPGNIDVLFQLASTLFGLSKYEEASGLFREIIKERPKNEPASLGLFHSLWELGNRREAYGEMRRFLAISDSREYETLLSEIDEIMQGFGGSGERPEGDAEDEAAKPQAE